MSVSFISVNAKLLHNQFMCYYMKYEWNLAVEHPSVQVRVNPLSPIFAIWVQLQCIRHPVLPDRIKPSFVIFDIRAL